MTWNWGTGWRTIKTCAICGRATVIEHSNGWREYVLDFGGVVFDADITRANLIHRDCYEKKYGLWGAAINDGSGLREVQR